MTEKIIHEVLHRTAQVLKEQSEINKLLLAYIEADLEKPWVPAAKRLAKKLKEITK